MKTRHLLFSFILIAVIFSLASCSNGDDAVPIPEGDYVNCDIDGVSFSSDIVAASYGLDIFAITGMTLSGEQFVNITIFNPTQGETYNLEDITSQLNETNVTAAIELDENYTARRNVGSGTITLSYFDGETAAGTFSVVAEHWDGEDTTITITNGEFSTTSIIQL